MGTYFKFVRPDGTDWRTGTVYYSTDRTLPELPGGPCCTGLVYHVSTTPEGTMIGSGWPGRLFEVEAEPVSEEGTKRGVRTMTVLRELPAHLVFGPQGEDVAAIIERARLLTMEEVLRAPAWDTAKGVAWDAARDAAWDAARDAAWDAARDAAWAAAWAAAWDAVWDAAMDAASYATLAAIVRDLISTEHYELLAAPWRTMVRADSSV